jgi:hypothetical protein
MHFYAPFIRNIPPKTLPEASETPLFFFSRRFIFTFANEEKKHDRSKRF